MNGSILIGYVFLSLPTLLYLGVAFFSFGFGYLGTKEIFNLDDRLALKVYDAKMDRTWDTRGAVM